MNYRSKCLFVCSAMLSLLAGSALQAQSLDVPGLYLKGDFGGNIRQDTSVNEFFGPVAPGTKIKFDPGFRAGLQLGYQAVDWLAGEVEVGFMGNNVSEVTGATELHDVYFGNVPVMFNARLQWPTGCRFTPYAGAGVGFSESYFDIGGLELNGIRLSGSDVDTVFAWQAFAGIRYALNDRLGLAVEYHYFHADSPSWTADLGFPTPSDRLSFGATQTHAISLAVQLHF